LKKEEIHILATFCENGSVTKKIRKSYLVFNLEVSLRDINKPQRKEIKHEGIVREWHLYLNRYAGFTFETT
jgi:hypothetical protein